MKYCPFCGAALSDGASFCIYCMRALTEKRALPSVVGSRRKKKRLRTVALILAAVLFAGALGGAGLGLITAGGKKMNLAPDPNDPRTRVYADVSVFKQSYHYPIVHSGTRPWSEEWDGVWPWEPWDLTLDRTENGWACYTCPGIFQNELPQIFFKLDGTAVLIALNAIRQDERGRVGEITEHFSRFMYRAETGGIRLYEMLNPTPAASFIPDECNPVQLSVSDYSPIERLGITKPGGDVYKDKTTEPSKCACFYRSFTFPELGEDNRFFEFDRVRVDGDEVLHDYFFYFTFGEEILP